MYIYGVFYFVYFLLNSELILSNFKILNIKEKKRKKTLINKRLLSLFFNTIFDSYQF